MADFDEAMNAVSHGGVVTRATWGGGAVFMAPGSGLRGDQPVGPVITGGRERTAMNALGLGLRMKAEDTLMRQAADGAVAPWEPTDDDRAAGDWRDAALTFQAA